VTHDAKVWDMNEFTLLGPVARMWYRGVPIDPQYVTLATDPAARLRLKERLINDTRIDYPIYDD
jgi:hypothetical protein